MIGYQYINKRFNEEKRLEKEEHEVKIINLKNV